ncbi:unnamed protein product [Arctogadus glacialis]
MGATDLEEALHVAERCENARMTLQRDYVSTAAAAAYGGGGPSVQSVSVSDGLQRAVEKLTEDMHTMRVGMKELCEENRRLRAGDADTRGRRFRSPSGGGCNCTCGEWGCQLRGSRRLGVEALARTGVPDVRTSPGDVRTSPGDVRTSPGDAVCTSCHDSRMLTTAIRETAGSWCRGPNASYSYGPVSLEESPVTAEQRAKLAELLQRDGLQPDPRNTDKTLSSQMLLQPGFAPWPQWRCLTTLRLQTGHKQSQFLCIHSVVVELNCGQHSVKTLTLVLC